MNESQAPPQQPLTPEDALTKTAMAIAAKGFVYDVMRPSFEQEDMRELVQRLARVQAKIADPEKLTEGDERFNKKTRAGVKQYRFADLTTVLQVVRPALASEGIAFTQTFDDTMTEIRLSTRLLYGCAYIESLWLQPLPPMPVDRNGSPMAMGLAQVKGACATYARRKALLAIVGVQDDEQDDPDLGGEREPVAETRKDEIREKAQARAATTQASTESAPQPMTAEELRAQALRLQKWAAQRGVQIPATGVLKVLFDAKKWDIMSRKDVQEWGRTLDDLAFEPAILAFLRANFGPATQPEAASYPPSNPAAVMKAIVGWAKVQGLDYPENEGRTQEALASLINDLGWEYSSMTPEKWGAALAKLLDPKQTAHWVAVLGPCYPPF